MFVCRCLNVGVETKSQPNHTKIIPKINAVPGIADYECLEFIKTALGPFRDFTSAIHHDALVQSLSFDRWCISKCMNCDMLCFATAKLPNGSNELLVNPELACDEAQLNSMIKCDRYSMPFKIILQPIDALPRAHQTLINEDPRVKALFSTLREFITSDNRRIDEEIRRLNEEKTQRQHQAEKDFKRLVALIDSVASSTYASTKLSDDEIESLTPPVTPETNDKMSIDDVLPLKQANAKHNSAIGNGNPRITRVINFEDNIFELEGMQEEDPVNDVDRYHKYSDTEDDDHENIVEKRAMRGRSGSINIARSAPISMPLFTTNNHMTSIDIDEIIPNRAVNELHQMDIASSIKMLARSVHASDAVFGELPARRCNKF